MSRKRIRKHMGNERKTAIYVWCFESDCERILAVADMLRLPASGASQVARLLLRGIARGDFAVVPTGSTDELERTAECIKYIRRTFGTLHRPQERPLKNILAGLRAALNAREALAREDSETAAAMSTAVPNSKTD